MFSVYTTPEGFENATITGHFKFVFEENSVREITWLSFSKNSVFNMFSVHHRTKSYIRVSEIVVKGLFIQAIFVAATRCNFCRAKIASSFKHVRNPCDIAVTNRTWFTRTILKLEPWARQKLHRVAATKIACVNGPLAVVFPQRCHVFQQHFRLRILGISSCAHESEKPAISNPSGLKRIFRKAPQEVVDGRRNRRNKATFWPAYGIVWTHLKVFYVGKQFATNCQQVYKIRHKTAVSVGIICREYRSRKLYRYSAPGFRPVKFPNLWVGKCNVYYFLFLGGQEFA